MAVERDGRIAEQQDRGRMDGIAPFGPRRGLAARQLGRRRLAIHDVLLFEDGHFTRLHVLMPHGDEQQGTGAARLFLDLGHRGHALGRHADLERLAEFDPAARPHAVAVLGGRQEAAARGMPIRPQTVHAHRGNEERPLPQRRQVVPLGRHGPAQRGGDARGVAGIHGVRLALAAADPCGRICRCHAESLWWSFHSLKHARKPSPL